MKVLVVGGTGFVGGYLSLFLRDLGHEVTLMSRSAPRGTSRLNTLPFVAGDYAEEDFTDGRLEGYDWLMFCAGNDMGNFPHGTGVTPEDFFERKNIVGIPRFFEQARGAGIARTAYMGSFYSFVHPEAMATNPYIRSRHMADAAVRAMDGPGFHVASCALPWIVGHVPGLRVAHWEALAKQAAGRLPAIPEFAPPGGANFMTCHATAQAMLGALERGEGGKSYLIGDVNLTWKDYFELWFAAAGRPVSLPVRDDDHPIVPREFVNYLTEAGTSYEPPAEETALLGYERGRLASQVRESQAYYAGLPD